MKAQLLIGFMTGLLTVGLLSFVGRTGQADKNSAEVEQVEGLYLFHQAKPVSKYQVLGTISLSTVITSNARLFTGREANLIRKARKKYPEAEALIIDEDGWQADVIKFN